MGVIRYDIIEEAFQLQKLPSAELSILTGVDSSSYLIADANREVLGIRALGHQHAENWWTADEHLQHHYQKVRLAWLDHRFSLVPTRLYNVNDRRNYLSDLTTLQEGDTVLADAIPELDLHLVYPIQQQQLDLWRHNFVGCRFYHALTPILQQLARQSSQLGLPRMYAYVRDGLLVCVGIDRQRLQFCNAFPCPAAKDYLYYLLLAYEQCGWKAHKVPLRVFGEIVPEAEVFKLFYRYVRDIEFLSGEALLRWGHKTKEQATHLFYDLAALHHFH